ncbi:MAG: 6-carboxytetrahydropterin synthase [Ignavibacteria bacterium]|nr:6-carboxytetrahydropterin synthase [Ignavibacteria bacterium]
MKVYLTRKTHFAAAHRLFNPNYSDEQNKETFGLCSNPNYHGHNYNLEVTVEGEPDPETGYVIDLKYLKKILNENIIDHVDHKNLNVEVDFLEGINPTVENLCIAFWKQLENKIPNGKLHAIKLYESERNLVEYRGE